MRSNICDVVADSAGARPTAPAATYQSITVTYAELWTQVLAVANGLVGLGLDRGERIGIFLEKRHETVSAVFGTAAAGGAFVPINPLLRARQVGHILRDSGARVLITSAERLALLLDELRTTTELREVIVVGDRPSDGTGIGTYRVHTWDEVLSTPGAPGGVPVRTVDVDLAAILYTSGSTGGPKGVALTHRNLIAGAESVNQYLGNGPDDVILAVLPLSFDAGFSQLTTGFAAGAHVVLMNYLLPGDVVRACRAHRVTAMTCVPPLWHQLVDQDWSGEAGETLRYFANTGGRMPSSTLAALRSAFPSARPYLMYGLTEAFRSTYLDPAEVDRRPDSIGKAIPNAEVLAVRPDGSECGPGEEGELVHRGALVALGYWNDPERTAERFRPAPRGWGDWGTPEIAVWSGDVVRKDEEGFLYFVGRRDEMIKTSGYRVSPTEVEEAVYATGLVRDAVAMGIDDARLGQRILLVVTGSDGAEVDLEALRAELRRQLPLYMVPAEIVEVPEIPRGPNGKYDRARLRQERAT